MIKIIILACMLSLLTISCSKKVTTLADCLKLNGLKKETCLKKVASDNNAKAKYELGLMYEKGDVIEKDYRQAVDWYTESAKQGYAPAQYELGLMYYIGYGILPNYKQALYWYNEAAKQEDSKALFALGGMYENGKGVIQDDIKAADWYTKSAEQGLAEAQYKLGTIYETGKGVVQDDIKAYAWFSIAAAYNNYLTGSFKHLEYKMSNDDIQQAQDLAQELLKTIKK